MANDKKFIVKNGLTAKEIDFVDSISSPTQTITATMLPNGTLSFDGTAGQLFSITDDLTGTLFAVNDVSGIPSIEVDADGTIRLAEFAGNTLIGTATDNGLDKLQVNGTISASGFEGNATTATTLATARTISLGGDVSGSASFNGSANVTITATIADDSHNHVISNVDGLQTALDGKLATTANAVSATKLLTSRSIALGGDVTGSASFDGSANVTITATIADDSHNHVISNVDGLQTALDGKAASSHTHTTAQVTGLDTALAGKAASSHTHTTAQVTGLDTALAGKATTAQGALADSAVQPGDNISTLTNNSGYITSADGGAAATAATLATARTISLGGDVTGSASFNGASNVTITATIADDSHNHVISNVDGLQTALDGKASLTGGTFTGRVISQGSFENGTSQNFTARAVDGNFGQEVGYSFYPTFAHTGNGPRRAADILAGYDGGIWGTEYLSFCVGDGTANDAQNITPEVMRLNSDGTVTIGGNEAFHAGNVASQAEAEAGTDNTSPMTPLRTAQAIAVLGGGGGSSWKLKSSAYTAIAGDRVAANVSGSAWTLTLPASPAAGDFIDLAVIDGDASVNNLTISGNGNNIHGDTTLVIDLPLSPVNVSLIYNNTEWRIA